MIANSSKTQLPDPAGKLLLERELLALKLITAVRLILIVVMAPMGWVLGYSLFDRVATLSVITVYLVAVGVSAYLITHRRHLRAVGLVGVSLDVVMIGVLRVLLCAVL